jgi:hypothetical protein
VVWMGGGGRPRFGLSSPGLPTPAGTFQDDEDVMRAFEQANRQAITQLHRGRQFPGVAWIQLIPDTAERRAPGAVLWGFPSMVAGLRSDVTDGAPGFTDVRTRLGAADLAAVDALIDAGVVSNCAEVIRWPSAASAITPRTAWWILPVMADVTGGKLDECMRIVDSMWEVEVASRDYERQADHAAGMLLSGRALQAIAPGEILELVDRAIQVGYVAALKEIQSGTLDDDILEWRPDLAGG